MTESEKEDAVSIRVDNFETEGLARKLAALTGESLAVEIHSALAERYARLCRRGPFRDELGAIASRCASRPLLSALTDDQILGYDEFGVPTR